MQINGETVLHGIIGNPVTHSLSPVMHNAAFAATGINGVYLPFPAPDVELAVAGIRGLGVHGVSVTIPHKEQVIPFLDAVDPVAEKIGAVNTIVRNGETLKGLNSDWLGATGALETTIPLQGRKVVVLGAGGSARAIGFGLQEKGAHFLLASRTESRGKALAETLGCQWISLNDTDKMEGDILVNATSVGMVPEAEKCPVPEFVVPRFQVVMDIVYAPLTTRLLEIAAKSGCRAINGIEMLLYQGVAQFEMWTGEEAPVDVMRRALLAAIEKKK